ncbi:protease [Actinomadura rudentiformis]|uniref:Protease n=1 Tax=Actinomadura rudentiformis TaxID=359158 RepID=A0A6H9YMX7_9ACTN|nr:protease [Actinomadura rudentiformis]KAB2341856.1 protease [Actinomadura rudentiformis]
MSKLFLILHVLAAILAIGPVAVAASMFPPALRNAKTDPDSLPALRNLHRICRVYAVFGIAVPVFGFITASSMGVLSDPWLVISILLTAAAAAVLGLLVLPRQAAALAAVEGAPAASRMEGVAAERQTEGASAEHQTEGASGGGRAQRAQGEGSDVGPLAARLAMFTGVFNVLWAVVTILMIVRPGSTTGA